jgi:hypothetical protein
LACGSVLRFTSDDDVSLLSCFLQINEFPVLKADCIKFVAIFRNQMTLEMLAQLQILPTLVKHLQAESVVQLTYAADALWHFFSLKVSIYLSLPLSTCLYLSKKEGPKTTSSLF